MQFSLGMISLFVIAASAASKFAQSCEDIQVYGNELRASCRVDKFGELRQTSLNLNRCIKNGKGNLKCGKNGEYQASCINCSIRGHTDMECMCRNVDEGHRYVHAHVDLNDCIKNNHGVLDC